jgi:hypothetical protein
MQVRNLLLALTLSCTCVMSFVPNQHHAASRSTASSRRNRLVDEPLSLSSTTTPSTSSGGSGKSSTFEVTIDLPPSGSQIKARLNVESILSVPTELVVVRYKLPFGLNVEPVRGLAVVTQPGRGGEIPGDVLRYTTQWTLGLPSGESLSNTFASFAGGLKWQCSIFDVIKAKAWEQVVNALTSNTIERTDEIVLIFERPVDGVVPPELQ